MKILIIALVLLVALALLYILKRHLKNKQYAEWLKAKDDSHRFLGLKRSKKYGEY